jgi:hypothetical protein
VFRPLTFITLAMACGSGLYLYQVKHQGQMLDRQIDHTVKAIETARAQVRELSAEWTLEGNPERLRQLATQFLPDDRPIQPSQFIGLADLDTKLPAPRPLDAAPTTPPVDAGTDNEPMGVPDASVSGGTTTPAAPAPAGPVPAPSAPARVVTPAPVIAQARPVERKPVEAPRPPHEFAAVSAPTPAPAPRLAPRPAPMVAELERPSLRLRNAPPALAPMPMAGSLLGMAHAGASLPPPRPLPVSNVPVAYGNQ